MASFQTNSFIDLDVVWARYDTTHVAWFIMYQLCLHYHKGYGQILQAN